MRRQNLYLTRVEAVTFFYWRRACQVKISFLQLLWQLQLQFYKSWEMWSILIRDIIPVINLEGKKSVLMAAPIVPSTSAFQSALNWNMPSGWHHKIIFTPSKQIICMCSSLALVLDTVPHISHVVLMKWSSAVLSWPSAICVLKHSPLLPWTSKLSTFC